MTQSAVAIDLRSDTVTRPDAAMRQAMARAEVGDDVYGEDPTVRRLESRAAALVGKEAALFVPSGTMANQIAIRCHTRPGDALFAGHDAHVYLYEGGGAAALSGVQSVLIGSEGFFDGDDLAGALYPDDAHFARPRLVCLENTHNRSGGRVFPQAAQAGIAETAARAGLALHLDGARIFNAAVASGCSAEALCTPFDSVSFCLSKGLGAPVGSLLCGSRDFIRAAHRQRKLFGGGMRQAGILAAAGLHVLGDGLEETLAQLDRDHALARRLADGATSLGGVVPVRTPETNMVLLRVSDARGFVRALSQRGVLVGAIDATTIRAVTHRDVDEEQIDRALEIAASV